MFLFLRPLLLFSVGFLFFPGPLDAKPVLTSSLNSQQIHSKETLRFQIEIEWLKNEASYYFAIPSLKLTNLEVLHQGESQETLRKNGEDWSRKSFTYELQPQGTGKALIHSLVIPYVAHEGQKGGELVLAERALRVTSAPILTGPIAAGIIGLLLVIASGALALLRFKQKQVEKHSRVPEDPKNQFIDETKNRVLQITSEDAKQKIYDLSTAFKRFLVEFYGLNTVSFTESELIGALKSRAVSTEDIQEIKRLMDELHEAKFTGHSLNRDQSQQLNQAVLHYIESKKVVNATGGV